VVGIDISVAIKRAKVKTSEAKANCQFITAAFVSSMKLRSRHNSLARGEMLEEEVYGLA
jgi:hypothetical protein